MLDLFRSTGMPQLTKPLTVKLCFKKPLKPYQGSFPSYPLSSWRVFSSVGTGRTGKEVWRNKAMLFEQDHCFCGEKTLSKKFQNVGIAGKNYTTFLTLILFIPTRFASLRKFWRSREMNNGIPSHL